MVTPCCSMYVCVCVCVCVKDYPKLSQNYYGLLECLAQDHMTFVSSLEPPVFLYILSTISEGLVALGQYLPTVSLFTCGLPGHF